ncbi:uncharacterized protein EDB91DRAFT_57473 [Suillus paluster]|uniref:uncharacterized protein n=1 Tax=Suillus paluster TaxID=48578 RepID=UPI001B865C3B|nr:uncharacterized protein EDB91DRAFT_57473 [Suillus paluster]KAG1726615.1 hypothetical protein EDB91DRAFT_57473 [Suillus paluster]
MSCNRKLRISKVARAHAQKAAANAQVHADASLFCFSIQVDKPHNFLHLILPRQCATDSGSARQSEAVTNSKQPASGLSMMFSVTQDSAMLSGGRWRQIELQRWKLNWNAIEEVKRREAESSRAAARQRAVEAAARALAEQNQRARDQAEQEQLRCQQEAVRRREAEMQAARERAAASLVRMRQEEERKKREALAEQTQKARDQAVQEQLSCQHETLWRQQETVRRQEAEAKAARERAAAAAHTQEQERKKRKEESTQGYQWIKQVLPGWLSFF